MRAFTPKSVGQEQNVIIYTGRAVSDKLSKLICPCVPVVSSTTRMLSPAKAKEKMVRWPRLGCLPSPSQIRFRRRTNGFARLECDSDLHKCTTDGGDGRNKACGQRGLRRCAYNADRAGGEDVRVCAPSDKDRQRVHMFRIKHQRHHLVDARARTHIGHLNKQ